MKFVVAPDSYKESLSASEVAEAMKLGIRKVFPDSEVINLPIADGGEGTLEAVSTAVDCEEKQVVVMQADGSYQTASYLLLKDGTAVIEVAQSSGLQQIPLEKRNPFTATSFGMGEVILDAINNGATKIAIGLGGSACNDGGAGMLQALGVVLYDHENNVLGTGNQSLGEITHADFTKLPAKLQNIPIDIITDVNNPLLGKTGATYIFGKQKGATIDDFPVLDHNIKCFADVVEKQLGHEYRNNVGSGAAGGVGFALQTLNKKVKIYAGIDYILNLINFEEKIKNATLVLTGEGGTDFQTAYGKAPIGVTKSALNQNIPTIIVSGKVEGDLSELYAAGVVSVHSVLHTISTLDEAMKHAKDNIIYTTEAIIRSRFL